MAQKKNSNNDTGEKFNIPNLSGSDSENKEKFGLANIKKDLSATSADFLSNIQKELMEDEKKALRDFIKGAYRLQMEKEKEIEQLTTEIEKIRSAIKQASNGDWKALSDIKIPTRYFDEKPLRLHGKSLIEGSSEIRFLDLYQEEG